MTPFPEYHKYDGLGLAALMRSGRVAAVEVVEEAIRRIEVLNPRLNAVVHRMYEQARSAAKGDLPDGPFRGVPFLLKDLASMYEGVPTGSGNRLLQNIPVPHDSEIVRRYKAAGLLILGKTNTPEFGLAPVTEPLIFGATRNPWDLTRTPGGSSGGAAAAVAACLVPLAGGGDGGGSIRIPASCCGVFGLKPSRGRMPTGPDVGERWRGFAVEHVITRSVRDSAAVLDAVAGTDAGAPYAAPPQARPFLDEVTTEPGRLRVAFTAHPFLGHTVHQDCVNALHATARLLQDLGHDVAEDAPGINRERFSTAFMTILAAEARADVEWAADLAKRRASFADFEAGTYGLGLLGKALSASDYANAARYLQATARGIGRFFQRYDVLLTPTLSQPPVPIGALRPSPGKMAWIQLAGRLNAGWMMRAMHAIERWAAQTFDFIPYTPVFNVTGQPAMSVPLYWNDAGLPIGLHFVGRFGDEATLFRLAAQLERAQPWFNRRPALTEHP
ncbi:MAG: amidase [Acidobacteria bacterium]|nr:amidase [Acidobacteriota bacterium]